MKRLIILLILSFSFVGYAQFTAGYGYQLAFLNTGDDIYRGIATVYNENETVDFYGINAELGAMAHGIHIRSFGGQFSNPKKISFGYSLEIGYNHFASSGDLVYLRSSTDDPDSIVNAYNNHTFVTRYHTVYFNHFLDFHWNASETIKVTNSVGVGIGAIVSVGKGPDEIDWSIISTNHPILKVTYQPQITERYERFSIGYFASIDLFSIDLFDKPQPHELPDARIPFSSLRVNGIGVRIIPHPKVKKEEGINFEF